MWNKRILMVIAMAGMLVAGLAGCTKQGPAQNDPKGRLTAYIGKTFDVREVQDREQLLDFLTGEAKSRLQSWSDDQFRSAFLDNKREFIKLLFTEVKEVSKEQTNITYELTYLNKNKGSKVTNKKLCQMVQEQGKWFIKDVRNIKELVEYTNEMSLP